MILKKTMIIAIDGTSGSGKSTIAKKLAEKLNFGFFSAGELYRAITVKTLNLSINEKEEDKLRFLVDNTNVIYKYDGKKNIMIVDGVDITEKLHTEEVSNFVSKLSNKMFIREFVRQLQRETVNNNENIVMEGRDIGSVIFPNADLKIFIDCKVELRAKRRMNDYKKLGEEIPLEKVIEDLKNRDYRDIHRDISPLIMCENSFLIDTSHCNVSESLNLIFAEMLRRNLVSRQFLKEKGINVEKIEQ